MDCAIIGAGGHARVINDIFAHVEDYRVRAFVDENPEMEGQTLDGLPVLVGITFENLRKIHDIEAAIVAVGNNIRRQELAEECSKAGLKLLSAIHPTARIASGVSFGLNSVACLGSLICTQCQIGDSVILNTGCTIDHECIIGNGVHISPGVNLGGQVVVEDRAWVGIGATVIQGIRIGHDAMVGAGAVVIEDVPAETTVVGIPAKPKGKK